jgi:predicted lipid-binding transport protein (Tim44 family)
MMTRLFSLLTLAMALGLSLTVGDAEAAKRLGGGKSVGMQRQATPPPAAPSQSASSVAKPATPATPAAPAPAPGRSWMGPLAGLAAGLGLAALASHFGFGEQLASMLMIGLLVMAVMVVIGLVMRRRAGNPAPALSGAGAGPMQYSSAGAPQAESPSRPFDVAMPAAPASAAPTASSIPAGFDVAAFVRNAKVQFIRLQAANDARNLDDIRDFATPEMFAELKMNIDERGNAPQETDVVSIDADVLEVAEEAQRYVVSVRFTGQIREGANAPAETVDEIWHLVKPRDGKSGWLLAGIQQSQ